MIGQAARLNILPSQQKMIRSNVLTWEGRVDILLIEE
jgi:hypothetical protein